MVVFRSGIASMIAYSLFFSLMAVFVKVLSPRIPTLELVFYRCLLPLPFLFLILKRRGIALWPRNPSTMFMRMIFSLTSMVLTFWSVGQIPLADSALIGRLQPVFVAILAPYFLSEWAKREEIWVIAISLIGVAIILQPSLQVGNIGGFAALGAAAANAAAHIEVRRISSDEHPLLIVTMFSLFVACVTAPIALPKAAMPSSWDTLALLGMASVATAAQLFMTLGYRKTTAPAAAAATYSGVVFSVIWGFLFWGEIPDTRVWIGGTIVVAAGLGLFFMKNQAKKITL